MSATIKTARDIAQQLHNVSKILIIALKNQLSQTSKADPDKVKSKSASINYIENQFYTRINKFSELVNTDITNENFEAMLLSMYKNLAVILKMFTTQIIPIIEKNHLEDLIASRFKSLPKSITDILEKVTMYLKNGANSISKEVDAIDYRFGSKNDTKDVISKKNARNDLSEEVVDSISNTLSTVIKNTLNLITFRRNSIDNTLDDVNNRLHSLNKQIVSSFGNGDKNITWNDFKGFFVSDPFVGAVTGLVASIGIFIVMKRLIRSLLARIRRLFD